MTAFSLFTGPLGDRPIRAFYIVRPIFPSQIETYQKDLKTFCKEWFDKVWCLRIRLLQHQENNSTVKRADMKNKVELIRTIVKLYFVAALAGSFSHIIEAAFKIGLTGWEAWSTPFMIDGLAIIGMVMRTESFSSATRKLGFRVQVVMGSISLVANVYAAKNIGGIIYGVAIVALFLAAEWLAERLESAQDAEARAKAEATAEKRSEAAKKAAATRKRNAQKKTREVAKISKMVYGK